MRRLWLDTEDLVGMCGESDVTMITPFLQVIWDFDWEVLRYPQCSGVHVVNASDIMLNRLHDHMTGSAEQPA